MVYDGSFVIDKFLSPLGDPLPPSGVAAIKDIHELDVVSFEVIEPTDEPVVQYL